MLSNFKEEQLLAYNLLYGDIENNCVTHAYLIDENNYSKAYEMVLSFVKEILCDKLNEIDSYNVCKRIDSGNYPEIKIINADGMYIKKQQIIELQQDFSRVAIEGNKRIYIIKDCEKMRAEAANSMLKFLEEPDDNIIAILMTNNINNVLSTIISRCKVVKLNNILDDNKLVDEELENIAIDLIDILENKGIDLLVNIKDVLFSKITSKDRDKLIVLFDIMVNIYYDVLKKNIGSNDIKYLKYKDVIFDIANKNKVDKLINKINILLEAKDSIKYNVNIPLLIDSVIIRIGGMFDVSRY